MTNTLGKLRDKGFISIEPDPTSGRRKIVRLTLAGRQAREASVAATYPLLEDFLRHFAEEDIAGFLPMLERIRAYLDALRA